VFDLLAILYVSGTQYFFLRILLLKKAHNVKISDTVQLRLHFKNAISFCLNSIVEQHNIIAK